MTHDDSAFIASGLEVLKRYASQGATLSYDDLHRELGHPFGDDASERIGKLCDAITVFHSRATGLQLMISVLVRDGDTGLPRDEFFALAAGLGRLAATDAIDARRAFVDAQERRVFMVFRPTKASTSGFAPNH
ncbi:hypothetical protein [Glycomyces tritici]|uniref:Uncharacterized protein n=1 Tax=Glycomyces tritici TaxID=2665176 RepID=A0ABT7YLP2_9ACTN|nr:hypothetical protein [Glycomyces tritici]MDN3239521.1 hypothetical protein [Glycomyces tritici]